MEDYKQQLRAGKGMSRRGSECLQMKYYMPVIPHTNFCPFRTSVERDS